MRTFVSLFFTVIVLAAVGWYVMYKNNPMNVCELHPEKSKEDKYLYCWPGIDWPLDTFIDGKSPIERRKFLNKVRNSKERRSR